MANTFTLIQANTLGSSAASVTFTSIPATYTHLCILMSARSTTGSPDSEISEINGSSANLQGRWVWGENGSVTNGSYSGNVVLVGLPKSSATANTFGNVQIYITNYTGSQHKSISIDSVSENNANNEAYTMLAAGLWSNTSAITSVKLSGNFETSSTFHLYGIKNS
jgi:hypothetical protein